MKWHKFKYRTGAFDEKLIRHLNSGVKGSGCYSNKFIKQDVDVTAKYNDSGRTEFLLMSLQMLQKHRGHSSVKTKNHPHHQNSFMRMEDEQVWSLTHGTNSNERMFLFKFNLFIVMLWYISCIRLIQINAIPVKHTHQKIQMCRHATVICAHLSAGKNPAKV